MKKLATIVFILAFIVYLATSAGRTPYDYFTRLAEAFLQGKYYITDSPPWLSELIPSSGNKFLIVYPPMPALLLLPFVAVFGGGFPQQLLAHLLGAGIVFFTFKTSLRIKKDTALAVWSSLLVGIGSIVWFLSATGSVWYLGQITSAFFLTVSIYEALGHRRPFLIGLFLGAAYLARPHSILAFLFFVLFLSKSFKQFLKNALLLGFGTLPFLLFDFYYNFIRWGTLFNNGYFLLPAILKETDRPWFIHGVVNPFYIWGNLKTMFWSFPKLLDKFPYIIPSWNGLAIWITTPAFIYALKANMKEKLTRLSWFVILPILVVIASHGGNGFAQFGYRFAVDFYPFLTLLTITAVAKTGLKWHHWLLLFIGIAVNFWGVIWINKAGWVSF